MIALGTTSAAFQVERHLVGAALLRLGLGGLILCQLLWQWRYRQILRGPNGMYPDWLFARELPLQRSPSLFDVHSELAFDALYCLTIVIALLYLVGWKARWTGICLYVLTWSFFHRNPMLVFGGEKLLLATFPYALLLNTSTVLAVERAQPRHPDLSRDSFAALFHNVGVFCIMAQLSIAYATAGLAKLAGVLWRDGTAVRLVLQTPEFSLPGITEALADGDLLVRALTYATSAFELGFPLLVWSKRTRWIAQLGAVTFHVAVGALMGLALFALQALVFQLVIADDRWYGRIARLVSRVVGKSG